MNHQLFESWILDDVNLSDQQKKSLDEHLSLCTDCNEINTNWKTVKKELSSTTLVSSDVDFSQRWKNNLTVRKEIAQKKRSVRLLVYLLVAAFILFLGLMVIYYENFSPIAIANSVVHTLLQLMIRLSVVKQTFLPVISSLPVFVPVTLWILFSTGFLLLVITWLVFLWRVATQGVYIK